MAQLTCRIDGKSDAIELHDSGLSYAAIAAGIINHFAASGRIVIRLDIDNKDCLDEANFQPQQVVSPTSFAAIETVAVNDFTRTALDATVSFLDKLSANAGQIAAELKNGQGGMSEAAGLYGELIWFIDLTDVLLSTIKAPLPPQQCSDALKSIAALIGAMDTGMATLDRHALAVLLAGDFSTTINEWRAIYVTAGHVAAAQSGEKVS